MAFASSDFKRSSRCLNHLNEFGHSVMVEFLATYLILILILDGRGRAKI